MTLIRNRKDISESTPTADLLETYNAMTGKDIKKFSSRAAAESQTANAIMAAEDAAGKLGVKKGQKPVAMTAAELDAARAAKAMGAEQLTKVGQGAKESANPGPAATEKGKSLRASLKAKAVGEPNKPKPKAEKKAEGAGRAAKVLFVVPTGKGRSKMQENSQRKAVFDAVVGKRTSAPKAPVDVEALQEDFHSPIRGHILKLIFEGHLAAVAEDHKD